MYIPRALETTTLQVSSTFPVLLLTGPRQVGKTTMLKHLAGENRSYLTLDDPDIRYLAKHDPNLLLQRYAPPVLIDEIQYAPELLPYIKMRVDSTSSRGDYWLTGSQAFHLMKDMSESLAGRVGIVRMLGLSNCEIDSVPTESFTTDFARLKNRRGKVTSGKFTEIWNRIFYGTMPSMYVEPRPDWERFYSSYAATYLQRDIRDLTQVANESSFYKFLIASAARTARPINYEEIARDVGITSPTVKKWISLLETSGIIALVQPYSNNVLKRATKMPLMHFLDTGLVAWLLKWQSPEVLERGAMSGQLFESYVFAEIYKSWLNCGKEPPLYFYRDKDKREIDLIILQDGILSPVEIKKTASPCRDDLKNFTALDKLTNPVRGVGGVVCMTEKLFPLDEQNSAIPAWLI